MAGHCRFSMAGHRRLRSATVAASQHHDPRQPAAQREEGIELRRAPAPRRRGPLAVLSILWRKRMLSPRYARLFCRYLYWKARLGSRLQSDGPCFICKGVQLEVGRQARLTLGRWSWLGAGTKVRVHEGEVVVGAWSVLGQECTLSAYRRIAIGRECIIADRVMMIDFDHGMVEVERPIRAQGIYTRPVEVGHNVWIGYGACLLRGAVVGNNAVLGTYAVVTGEVPANAVCGGVPARVIRMREQPKRMRFE